MTEPAVLLAAGVLLAFVSGCTTGAVWMRLGERCPAHRGGSTSNPTAPRPVGPGRENPTMTTQAHRDDVVVFPAPTVRVDDEDVVLWTWMRHHHPRPEGLAQRVVRRFYDAAARDVEVADYFVGVDLPGLQRHFVRAFILLADKGLTTGSLRNLATRHAVVRNTTDQPVTPAVFDKVVAALGAALHAEGVPTDAIHHIARMCAPIRTALTT